MSESAENQIESAIQAGLEKASISLRQGVVDGVPIFLVPQGTSLEVPLAALGYAEKHRPNPDRKRGTSTHFELRSFVDHVNRYKDDRSVIFADPTKCSLTAIFNYNEQVGDNNGFSQRGQWGDHRAVYSCPLSDQWNLWNRIAGSSLGQEAFADLIEMNVLDIGDIRDGDDASLATAARLLEVARNLRIHAKDTFERKIDPRTGENSLTVKLEHSDSSTKIPSGFMLAIPVFRAGAKYRLEAKLRLRMENGKPSFTFVIPSAGLALEAAFNEVRDRAVHGWQDPADEAGLQPPMYSGTGLPLFVGTPE